MAPCQSFEKLPTRFRPPPNKKNKRQKIAFKKLDFYTIHLKLEIGEIPDLKFFYHVEDSYELF